MVHEVLNKEDLDKKIAEAGEKLIVIDFFANWCGPCRIIAPKLEELAMQYSDRAVVVKVNVDENEDIAVEYNVTSMPTFVFIKNGQIVEIFVGGNSEKLSKSMEKHVENEPKPGLLQLVPPAENGADPPTPTQCNEGQQLGQQQNVVIEKPLSEEAKAN